MLRQLRMSRIAHRLVRGIDRAPGRAILDRLAGIDRKTRRDVEEHFLLVLGENDGDVGPGFPIDTTHFIQRPGSPLPTGASLLERQCRSKIFTGAAGLELRASPAFVA